MSTSIHSITIEGFKSIRHLHEFKLNSLNILVGANGAGKSNFVDFFRLLREIVDGRLQFTIRQKGGADKHLFMGPKITDQIVSQIYFTPNGYEFSLKPTINNSFVFGQEQVYFQGHYAANWYPIASGHDESNLANAAVNGPHKSIAEYVHPAIASWVVYHFHDTSESARMRREHSVRDNEYLRPDAANLASFLWRLKQGETAVYNLIRDTIRLVAPFFDDFLLRPRASNGDEILLLEWMQKNSDYPFHPNQLSDGTLRFIALVTALLQPNPPATILLDEPELGLHPYALEILAGLMKKAIIGRHPRQPRTQLIVSTQSTTLLNAFDPENIIVVDREEGESRFRRLTEQELSVWLDEEYTLGELWQKNVYGGGPVYE
ncbi:MAG: AAA family ATPase [Chloroflexi bacterium]|nr:AAA family ATPase [Chloroflexota bacterium]